MADPEVKQQQPFEKNLDRLETIVRTLERGEAPLEEALTLFEEGVKLARLMSARLDEVEGRIEILMRMGTDGPETAEFGPRNGEGETNDA